MGLRIRTNTASLNAQRQLEETSSNLGSNMEKLSSGFRINRAADDAAGLAVSETLRAKVRSMAQAKRNASDGVSLIQVAEGSMNEVSNILIRLRELSVQASSDTIGNRERSFINKEYNQLVDEIDRIGESTDFNGLRLLRGGNADGNMDKLTIHIGVGDGSMPNRDTLDFELAPLAGLTTSGFGLETAAAALGPLDAQDESFVRETAAEKLKVLDEALQTVNGMRADLGAKQSRLNSTISHLNIAHENLSATNSRIKDVDFASETASYTQNRILQQGGISIMSQANSLPEVALSLLR